MIKRNRTRLRFDEFYNLALKRHQQGWSVAETEKQLQIITKNNFDLEESKAIATAKDEFRAMADLRLKNHLPMLRELAEKTMSLELAGTKKRFNHEMIKYCRRAAKHIRGPEIVIRDIEAEIADFNRSLAASMMKPRAA